MAGYMRKLNGHVYDGNYEAAEALPNGVFAELNAEFGVQHTSAAKDTKLRVIEKTALWGVSALVLTVVAIGEDEVFFVENEWDINDNAPYDKTKYMAQPGTLVRMHRPLVGEELIMTVADTLYDSLDVGDLVTPAANGTVAAA